MELAGIQKAVVVGLGMSGMAAIRFFRDRGIEVAVSEYRPLADLAGEERAMIRELAHETGGHSEQFVLQGDCIVPSPGVPLDLPVLQAARTASIPIVGELALAAGMFSVPVIGVTGSNGKTTVTSLIGTLLRTCGYRPFVGGNIGNPLLSALTRRDEYDVQVLELSSFQLDLAGEFRPDIGLLLNLTPDHLDRHGTMEAYVRAKMGMFRHQGPQDYAILGGDDPLVIQQAENIRASVATFGHGEQRQAHIVDDEIYVDLPGRGSGCFSLAGTGLDSPVNRLNAAAAILAVISFGAKERCVDDGLQAFVPAEHRMTRVAEIRGVVFINDSKATNVGAMAAALKSCPIGVVLIAGGRDKQGDFRELREIVRARVAHMLCIGEAAAMLEEVFGDLTRVERAADMQTAVARGAVLAKPGQIVLLAPGCASFDMFSDYKERGRVFTAAVHALMDMENTENMENTEKSI
ncbi:MAG TPA: UDP-N-acetylmuramoyl-L-alanine--D-glutamate ligase [Desulfobulbaceae bacterium]|nr:UDP-N-acetylmuramoyl-L-alanine--D-glutamate ligase [Desulfobulbaceae bacterium]